MRALGYGRRQGKNVNAGVAEGSKLHVAGQDRIIKMAGPALVAASPSQITHGIFKIELAGSGKLLAAESRTSHAGPNMPVGLTNRAKVQRARPRFNARPCPPSPAAAIPTPANAG
jgi:hypothetical protein